MTTMSDLMQMEPKNATSPEQAWKFLMKWLQQTSSITYREMNLNLNMDTAAGRQRVLRHVSCKEMAIKVTSNGTMVLRRLDYGQSLVAFACIHVSTEGTCYGYSVLGAAHGDGAGDLLALVRNELDTTDTSVLSKADTQDNVDEFLKEPVLTCWSDMQGLDW